MTDEVPATRMMVFLTEDDRFGHRSLAEELIDRARVAGLAAAAIWRGSEGFGASGHLRAARLPDLARGLPLVLEVIGEDPQLERFLPIVRELAAGALVTLESVRVARPQPPS
jgi:uncharacterized protein